MKRFSLLVLAFLMVFLVFTGLAPHQSALASPRGPVLPASGSTFSCGPFPHCYGIIQRPVGSEGYTYYYGVQTSIDLVSLSHPIVGEITNEVWILSTTIGSWIEAGYAVNDGYGDTGVHLFWADIRTSCLNNGLNCFAPHPGPRLSASVFTTPPKKVNVQISAISPSQGLWSVSVCISGGGSCIKGTSTNNYMYGDRVDEGSELSSASGVYKTGSDAYAQKALFDNNMFQGAQSGPWQNFIDNPTPGPPACGSPPCSPDNPPWAGWNLGRTPLAYGHGGQLYTCVKPYYGRNPC